MAQPLCGKIAQSVGVRVFAFNLRRSEVGGIGLTTRLKFLKRFELHHMYQNKKSNFLEAGDIATTFMNVIISRAACINYPIQELYNLQLIRLYLIKSMRGRAQALGKTSHGQRT